MTLATQAPRLVSPPTYLTVTQVAERLQVIEDTVRRWARSGKLPGQKFGGEWRFPLEAMQRDLHVPIPAWDAVPDPVRTCLAPLRERLANVATMVNAALYRPTPALLDVLKDQLGELSDAALLVRDIVGETAKASPRTR